MDTWNSPFSLAKLETRKNRTFKWQDPDSESAFLSAKKEIKGKGIITYSEDDIEYKFNSHGFRSDEYDDCDVLFAGCSFTEGIGLPLEHTWGHMLNTLISGYGLGSKFCSIGRGGLSASGIVRYAYHTIETLKVRPKFLFVLFPHVFRSEFFYLNFPPDDTYIVDYIPNMPKDRIDMLMSIHKSLRYVWENHEKNMKLSNIVNDFYKNLLFLHTLCERYGIKLFWHTWTGSLDTREMDLDERVPKEFLNSNGHVDLVKFILSSLPKSLHNSCLTMRDIHFGQRTLPSENCRFEQTIARDLMHPGPNSHYHFANDVFKEIKKYL